MTSGWRPTWPLTRSVTTVDSETTAVVLASVAVAAVLYEWAAIRWRRVPTITELIHRGGWPARIAVVAAGSLALLDHFVTGVWL